MASRQPRARRRRRRRRLRRSGAPPSIHPTTYPLSPSQIGNLDDRQSRMDARSFLAVRAPVTVASARSYRERSGKEPAMNTFATVTDRTPAAPALSAADLDAIKAKQRATWGTGDYSI